MPDLFAVPPMLDQGKRRFHLMAKPVGSTCNLDCTYCYYLGKPRLLGTPAAPRMSDEVLEAYVRAYLGASDADEVTFTWQGGEPTLAGLPFFEQALALQRRYARPGVTVHNDLQTNGTLLDDEWCAFLAANDVLVGLSVDGPRELHDRYRLDRNRRPSFDRVLAAARRLQRHGVKLNVLTAVNRVSATRPLDVYRFLTRELGASRIQLIPVVEPVSFETVAPQRWEVASMPTRGSPRARPGQPDSAVTEWSVDPDDWGTFLIKVFDAWYRNDVGKHFVYHFECAVGQWLGTPAITCTAGQHCGQELVVEHDGSVYSCDHHVYPEYRLGNVRDRDLAEMVGSAGQRAFGTAKSRALPRQCRECRFGFACNGECPRTRFIRTVDGEPGLSYLCSGQLRFLAHVEPHVAAMADRLRRGLPARATA